MIVTEQTHTGVIEHVASESESVELVMRMETFWRDQERTLMTRIEIEEE